MLPKLTWQLTTSLRTNKRFRDEAIDDFIWLHVESFETEALEDELLAKGQEEPGPRQKKEQRQCKTICGWIDP
jgi:hypothetical protein